ncbi:hypothetical protein [Denitrobacterium detoxificans]|uniref:hypothetical protein n=1 Tax=Denitrobacterium detoxificans TaxID=79604 RepID=UPI0014722FF3|nr:hypothetical protein [Denitrobacterium detoxificans]
MSNAMMAHMANEVESMYDTPVMELIRSDSESMRTLNAHALPVVIRMMRIELRMTVVLM